MHLERDDDRQMRTGQLRAGKVRAATRSPRGKASANAPNTPNTPNAPNVPAALHPRARRRSPAMVDPAESERREEARYRALVTVGGQIVWTSNGDGSGAGSSGMAGWSAYTGMSLDAIAGLGWLEAVHPDDRESTMRAWLRAVAGRELYETEYRLRRHDGVYRDFLVRAVPVLNADGSIREWAGISMDITERKLADAERAELLARELATARHLRALQAVTEAALTHLALDDLMPRLLDCVMEALDADHTVILLVDDGGQSLTARAARGLDVEGSLGTRVPMDRGVAGSILRSKAPRIIEDLSTVEVVNPRLRDRLRSLLGVPLLLDERVVGVILVGTIAVRRFADDDVRLLERVAERVTLAIGQARQYEAERHAREEAASRAAQLGAMIDSMADGVIVCDREGRTLRTNSAVRNLLGLDMTPEISTSRGVGRWTLRDERGRLLSEARMPLFRVLRGETLTGPNAVDVTLTTHDGHEVELSLSAAPVLDAAGERTGAVLIFRDVTDRRRLERRTAESLGALLAMAETLVTPDAGAETGGATGDSVVRLAELTCSVLDCQRVVMLSVDPRSLAVSLRATAGLSRAHERIWRKSLARLSFSGLFTIEEFARLSGGEPVVLDTARAGERLPYATPNGRSLLLAPMRLGEELVGLLVVDHEAAEHTYGAQERALAGAAAQLATLVIERERLLREYAVAQASELALRAANRQMDDFLSMASHELRTPLTSIKAYVQVAQRRLRQVRPHAALEEGADVAALVAAQVEAVQVPLGRANQHSDVLNRLVGDLLDASRIQGHRLEMRTSECDLIALVREAVEEQQLAWPERAIELGAGPEPTLMVAGDADRLKQVVGNFLTNALKYAPADQPVLVGLRVEDTVQGRIVRISVRDFGPGLPPDQLQRVWDRFHRADGVRTQNGTESGLGLGLYISLGIVELHGGTAGVESAPGEGSTFFFTLPLATADAG